MLQFEGSKKGGPHAQRLAVIQSIGHDIMKTETARGDITPIAQGLQGWLLQEVVSLSHDDL